MALAIGLMSGTSLDGVDGVLAEFDDATLHPLNVLAHGHGPMPPALRSELLALNGRHGGDELHRAALAAIDLMALYSAVAGRLLHTAGVAAGRVSAIGAHGQTVRHQPDRSAGGYTLQLVNGAWLAEHAGIDVICDFRSADVAAGGQGAPLVPAFHAACFGRADRDVALLNLGGIANLTVLRADGTVTGFDCGPGNVLLDLWSSRHLGTAYDDGGRWAAGGRVDAALLQALRREPYFGLPPPKSTGRDLFDAAWLERRLAAVPSVAPVDVMATLIELTATSAADAARGHAAGCTELLVCGGGAANAALMQRLQKLLGGVAVQSTAAAGVPPDQVEALAFAWLALRRLRLQPGSLPAVTGARGPRVLGAWYAAPAG